MATFHNIVSDEKDQVILNIFIENLFHGGFSVLLTGLSTQLKR